ncbi:ankyrin repeat-containing domain protein, partial [Russula brevipes]
MEDIVLVTGCDLTKSWANIALLQGRGRVSFGVAVPDIEWQFPPEELQGVALNLGPGGQDLPENQCIFIRGFRVTRLFGILPRLRAAGPSQNPDPDPDEPELDMQLLNISADSNYQDPLHRLLEYIAMKAPDCDMIIVHDDDLMRIDNAPSTVMGHPRRTMPEVWQVQCGGSEAERPKLKVATLSNNPLGTLCRELPRDALTLLEHGADAIAPDNDGRTPLHLASFEGDLEVIRILLGRGADTTAQDKDGWTPFRLALLNRHEEVALVLLNHDADWKAQGNDGVTPLHLALMYGDEEVALFLLQHGADMTARDNEGKTALQWASLLGNMRATRALLDRGADAATQDMLGWTPLNLALFHAHEEVALVLLEHGADATSRDHFGR